MISREAYEFMRRRSAGVDLDPERFDYKMSLKDALGHYVRNLDATSAIAFVMTLIPIAILLYGGVKDAAGNAGIIAFAALCFLIAVLEPIIQILNEGLCYVTKQGVEVRFLPGARGAYIPKAILEDKIQRFCDTWDNSPVTTTRSMTVLKGVRLIISAELPQAKILDAGSITMVSSGAFSQLYKKVTYMYQGLSQSWGTLEYELGHHLVHAELPGEMRSPNFEVEFLAWRVRNNLYSSEDDSDLAVRLKMY